MFKNMFKICTGVNETKGLLYTLQHKENCVFLFVFCFCFVFFLLLSIGSGKAVHLSISTHGSSSGPHPRRTESNALDLTLFHFVSFHLPIILRQPVT